MAGSLLSFAKAEGAMAGGLKEGGAARPPGGTRKSQASCNLHIYIYVYKCVCDESVCI